MSSTVVDCSVTFFVQVIYWNISPEAFSIPFTSFEVRWYSIFFALGVIGAYLFGIRVLWLDFLRKSPLLREDQILNFPLLTSNQFIKNSSIETDDTASFVAQCNRWMQEPPAPQCISPNHFATVESNLKAQKRLLLERSTQGAIATAKGCVVQYGDTLIWVLFVGMLIGARCAEVFFYDFAYYKEHPAEIIKVWKGGLASHGGVAGIVISFILFWNFSKNKLSFLAWQRMADIIAIATAFTAGCIRIGNLFNQEILGKPTDLPWGFVFSNPQDVAYVAIPCHPVQLYEAIAYFSTFIFLVLIEKKYKGAMPPLFSLGMLFILVFSARFCIEWLKVPQETGYVGGLNMGQLLSIPFIIVGMLLLGFSYRNKISNENYQ